LRECNLRVCVHLLELIEKQEEIIEKQNKTIAELVNENYEQENMIKVLMRDTEVE
jgi:hypothetical protein